jgi:hypothetical protein
MNQSLEAGRQWIPSSSQCWITACCHGGSKGCIRFKWIGNCQWLAINKFNDAVSARHSLILRYTLLVPTTIYRRWIDVRPVAITYIGADQSKLRCIVSGTIILVEDTSCACPKATQNGFWFWGVVLAHDPAAGC